MPSEQGSNRIEVLFEKIIQNVAQEVKRQNLKGKLRHKVGKGRILSWSIKNSRRH